MAKDKKINRKPVIENRQAKYNYKLLESFEAGISLLGWEVKSIRASSLELKDSYILMKKGEAYIIGLSILPLKEVTFFSGSLKSKETLADKK